MLHICYKCYTPEYRVTDYHAKRVTEAAHLCRCCYNANALRDVLNDSKISNVVTTLTL